MRLVALSAVLLRLLLPIAGFAEVSRSARVSHFMDFAHALSQDPGVQALDPLAQAKILYDGHELLRELPGEFDLRIDPQGKNIRLTPAEGSTLGQQSFYIYPLDPAHGEMVPEREAAQIREIARGIENGMGANDLRQALDRLFEDPDRTRKTLIQGDHHELRTVEGAAFHSLAMHHFAALQASEKKVLSVDALRPAVEAALKDQDIPFPDYVAGVAVQSRSTLLRHAATPSTEWMDSAFIEKHFRSASQFVSLRRDLLFKTAVHGWMDPFRAAQVVLVGLTGVLFYYSMLAGGVMGVLLWMARFRQVIWEKAAAAPARALVRIALEEGWRPGWTAPAARPVAANPAAEAGVLDLREPAARIDRALERGDFSNAIRLLEDFRSAFSPSAHETYLRPMLREHLRPVTAFYASMAQRAPLALQTQLLQEKDYWTALFNNVLNNPGTPIFQNVPRQEPAPAEPQGEADFAIAHRKSIDDFIVGLSEEVKNNEFGPGLAAYGGKLSLLPLGALAAAGAAAWIMAELAFPGWFWIWSGGSVYLVVKASRKMRRLWLAEKARIALHYGWAPPQSALAGTPQDTGAWQRILADGAYDPKRPIYQRLNQALAIVLAQHAGMSDEARLSFLAALRKEPWNAFVRENHLDYAWTLLSSGNPELAREAATTLASHPGFAAYSLEKRPDDAPALLASLARFEPALAAKARRHFDEYLASLQKKKL